MTFIIRRATPEDSVPLTTLTVASKAYWGYDDDFMRKAIPYMKVTADEIARHHVYVLEMNARIVGYYQLEARTPEMMWLESLFIAPEAIGHGCGRALMDHARALAASLGARKIAFESDPNAEAFYARLGAVRVGERESPILKGRVLPLMEIAL